MTDRAVLGVHCTPPLEQLASLSHGIIRRYYITPQKSPLCPNDMFAARQHLPFRYLLPPLGHLLVVMTKLHLIKCLSHGYAETGVSLSPVPAASIRWSRIVSLFYAPGLEPTAYLLLPFRLAAAMFPSQTCVLSSVLTSHLQVPELF